MKKLFNDNWKFCEFDIDASFEEMMAGKDFVSVDVPHDWMIYHTQDLYQTGMGCYRKKFSIETVPGKTYIFRFEGVYMDSHVYLNGIEIGGNKYGYSTFEADATEYIRNGENEIAVTCCYRNPNSRWYSGAGIYRNVWMIEAPEAYLLSDGCYISTKALENGFIVKIDCEVKGSRPCDAILRHTIVDACGNTVKTCESYVPICCDTYVSKQKIFVESPNLWDIDSPYLYKVRTELINSSKDGEVDFAENPLGFRTISWDCNKGFFLNGRRVQINGACQHHDLGALGAAVNKTAIRRQLVKLKKMGVNSIRTSHNMPSVEFMELADEMGILVNSEAFDMWELPKTEFDYGNYFSTCWKKDTKSWIRRDRNHPSIIMWSIGNEIYDTHAGNGYKWNMLLRDAVREFDYYHNAYIGNASNYIEWEGAQRCADQLELSGYNYCERLYDEHHAKYPDWCIFGSETGSTVQSRGIYHFPLEVRLLTYEDGQCSCLGNCSTNWGSKDVDSVVCDHRDREFVWGQYIWTGWDYIGEPTPYHSKNSYFGQIDTAGFEKDTYYHYQAEWTDVSKAPMVHILPYWDFNKSQEIDVCVYSNASEVELILNGRSLGRKTIDHKTGRELEAVWKVKYEPGTIQALAYDENGKVIASDEQKSFTDPKFIVLSPEPSYSTWTFACADDAAGQMTDVSKPLTLLANGEDLAFIEITTQDANHNFVANARNRVNVQVTGEGRLVGLDNGDSTDYEQYKGSSRKLFSGKLMAIIASTDKPGDIKISVTGEGLVPTELTIKSVPAAVREGISCFTGNYESPEKSDIPVRKIELENLGVSEFDKDTNETKVMVTLLPGNSTYKDFKVKALTYDGVSANFAEVSVAGNIVTVKALGDGKFRLCVSADNDKDHPEVLSELEFEAKGLGTATHNPYDFVPGCMYDSASDECPLSFEGGVFVPKDGKTTITYTNIDFGDFGSDEISIPIFTFEDTLQIEIIETDSSKEELLGKFKYFAESIYNVYQQNTFKLNKRLKGKVSLKFVFDSPSRFSMKGFSFTQQSKAYSKLNAVENSRISGDSYNIESDRITSIGNNVNIDFDNMDFGKDGLSKVTICGRSNNPSNPIHFVFLKDGKSVRQMVEIPYSEDFGEYTFDLDDIRENVTVSLVFLPGSNFDLMWIKFTA